MLLPVHAYSQDGRVRIGFVRVHPHGAVICDSGPCRCKIALADRSQRRIRCMHWCGDTNSSAASIPHSHEERTVLIPCPARIGPSSCDKPGGKKTSLDCSISDKSHQRCSRYTCRSRAVKFVSCTSVVGTRSRK